jgi:hypothetical protein
VNPATRDDSAAGRGWQGEVAIRSPQGDERRYERYAVTVNPDDSRTLQARTVSPNGTLVRDVLQTVSRDWRPLHGSSRLWLNGSACGVVSKWVAPDGIHSSVFDGQAFSYERFALPAVPFSIGFHPIADESWKMALIDASPGAGRQNLVTHTCSPTWNGKTIEHGKTVNSEVEPLGVEMRIVGGLAQACRAFLWHTPFGKQLKIWALGDDYLFAGLLVIVGDNAGTEYLVTRLTESA